MSETLSYRRIVAADDPAVAELIRVVMTEHGASGPGFAIHDPEVQAMSVAYGGIGAEYFVVEHDGKIVGGAGYGRLAGAPAETCELRKMYFLPEARGLGMGKKLLLHTLDRARANGYRTCYLETLKTMGAARKLYEAVGFERMTKPMGTTGHFGCDAWYSKSL